MSDDVLIGKAAIIERCVARAREELAASPDFSSDLTRQDAAVLNIQRSCEAAIDMAFRMVRLIGLGAPASSRDAIDTLVAASIIDADLAMRLKRMVGFRNVAVHRYAELDIKVVEQVILSGLDDLLIFVAVALRF